MLIFRGPANLHRVVVLNPKGGSGKTTLAFNLAGYLAATGRKVAIVDMDRQGSSTHWLQNRSSDLPKIACIPATDQDHRSTREQDVFVPEDIEYIVVDAPAGISGDRLIDYTCGAHAIFIPILPSDLDIHAASRLISDLLLKAQVSRRNARLGVVANRIKERTIAYQKLMRFLNRLSIKVVGVLRDSQNYAWAAEKGLCIHEMPPSRVDRDLAQWEAISRWLESRLAMPLTRRDLLRPGTAEIPKRTVRKGRAALIPAAAAAAILSVSLWLWSPAHSPDNAQSVAPHASTTMQQTAPIDVAVRELPKESKAVSAAEKLKDKWRLSGVAYLGGSGVLILRDRLDNTSRRISEDSDLDGWIVQDLGSDYAVFAQNGEEVRLLLNEPVE